MQEYRNTSLHPADIIALLSQTPLSDHHSAKGKTEFENGMDG